MAPTGHLLPDEVVAFGATWTRRRTQLGPQAGHAHFDRSARELRGADWFLAQQPQCQIDPVDLTEPAFVDRPAAPRDKIVLELLQLPG